MARPFELLTKLSSDQFAQVVGTSPKKIREELFRRAGIRNRGGAFALRTDRKTEARTKKLYDALVEGLEVPDEIGTEVIRHYLYHRRDLLAEALDFLEVEHDHGLTDADLDFVAEMDPARGAELRATLLAKHDEGDVDLYLGFMEIRTR